MSEADERARVVAIARSWLGTPYHEHAALKGAGVDCAQLLRVVYAEAGLIDDFDPGWYPPQFFLHHAEERYLGTVLRFAREIAAADAKPGDSVLYRMGHCYGHGGIVVAWPGAIVHAYRVSRGDRGAVIESHGLVGRLGQPVRAPRFFTLWPRAPDTDQP